MVRKRNRSTARNAQIQNLKQRYQSMALDIGSKFIPDFDLEAVFGKLRDEKYVLLRFGLFWYFRKIENKFLEDIEEVSLRNHATIIHGIVQYTKKLDLKEPMVMYFHSLLEKYIKAKFRKERKLLPPIVFDYQTINHKSDVNFKALPR
jgi:hypothetical protein